MHSAVRHFLKDQLNPVRSYLSTFWLKSKPGAERGVVGFK
jgi:hypothetical protein